MLQRTLLTMLLGLVIFLSANAQNRQPTIIRSQPSTPTYTQPANTQMNTNYNQNYSYQQVQWVDQMMQKMTPEQRIGQLFMVAAYSNKDYAHEQSITSLIRKHNIGGVIFMQGTPEKQIAMNNAFQRAAKVPLMMAIDGEWGLSMRLKKTTKFPRQLMLGAIQDNNLIYDMGKEIARQCKRVGVHVNFAPVVDVNNNPRNPVINDRSFGEDKYNVAQKGIAYMQGMEQNGILACAKHFPGHGDTDVDSHYGLPVIKHDINRLRNIELYPFQEMAKRGVGSMMIAHLAIPALDNTRISSKANLTMPTTLSKPVVTNLLRREMGYNGLIFTDALNMKGVSKYFPPGVVDAKALLAGNDVLLFSQNVGKGIQEIKKAIARGEISQNEIDNRVRKILKAKFRVGLSQFRPISASGLTQDLNRPSTKVLKRKLIENALTLARNDRRLIPMMDLNTKKTASLSIGVKTLSSFQSSLGRYGKITHHTLRKGDSADKFRRKFAALKKYDRVIISVHEMSKKASANYGINDKTLSLIKQLQRETDVIVVLFGSPYSLKFFDQSPTVLVAYEENYDTQDLSAQLIYGVIPAKGKLPITASPIYNYGMGMTSPGGMRLKYTIPEEVGFDSRDLSRIDQIAQEAIDIKATPGCQVVVAKDGKVIFQKSYGYHTYHRKVKVKNDDLYDIASITKVAASMLGVMEMYDNKRLRLTDRLSDHLAELRGTNKKNLVVRDVLMHQSGLKDWIPFYEKTLPGQPSSGVYKQQCNDYYTVEVAKNMYMVENYQQSMWQELNQSPVGSKKYKYSDLGFYYMAEMIQRYAGRTLDKHLEERYYKPLGLPTMCFNPRQRFSTYSVIPTENDTRWRKQVVHGHVHDMGAAMMGGIAGHAGLFSNANDLAVLMQMLMDGGKYGGQQYFSPETIRKFTSRQSTTNRRGIGFDKPALPDAKKSAASKKASETTFGHTGFTGTCAWADPANRIVYIFLSNRVYPKSNNWKLVSKNIRTRIHDVIYEANAKSRARWQQYN